MKGVLVVKKRLVSQLNPPAMSGGGTVFYVTKDSHRFLSNRVERYEGGTPNVVGIWRLGLAWQFKQQLKKRLPVGQSLEDYEIKRAKIIQERLKQIPNLMLLDGNVETRKVPVFSFLVKCGSRFLHYNYVCALLNDLFGIQSRGGCQCAGPYAQMMLGMLEHNQAIEHWLVHSKDESLRPGVTRFSLPSLGTSPEQQEYVLNAISWVAKHGWKFMYVYCCNQRTGEWRHKSRPGAPLGKKERRWLSHYDPFRKKHAVNEDATYPDFQRALENANALLEMVLKDQSSLCQALKMTEEMEQKSLRWYVYPKEVASFVQQGVEHVPGTFDKKLLVGAMRPIAWFGAENSESHPQQQARAEDECYRFQDGEHSGDAPLREIIEGYEDGELSELCQIYNPNTDSWELLVEFMKSQQQLTTTMSSSVAEKPLMSGPKGGSSDSLNTSEKVAEDSATDCTTGTSLSAADTLNADDLSMEKETSQTVESIPSELENLTVVEKREKKKPSRDSTKWGQGVKMPLQPQISPEEGVSSALRRKGPKHVKPPAKLMRLVTQGLIQWDMIQEGDRLLFVSG